MSDYGFTLHGINLSDTDDVLGVWSIPAQPPATSFDVSAPAAPSEPLEPTWRVSLPASIDEARSIIEQQQAALTLSEAALVQAEQRMAQLSPRTEIESSFAIEDSPEAELRASIEQLNQRSVGTAYALPGAPSAEAVQSVESGDRWQNFIRQVQDHLEHYTRVETEVANNPIGTTAVDWTGDFETIWVTAVTAESMTLHYHSVHLALASRLAMLHMITIVGAGAIGLAAKFAVPGGQLLALPAAWKFVQAVLKEWKNYQVASSK